MPPRLLRPARAAFLCACAAILTPALVACSSSDGASAGTPSAASSKTSTNDNSAAPNLTMPVSRFAVAQADLGIDFIVDIPATLQLTAADYAKAPVFASPQEGETLLKQWGYQGGYETGYTPEGREKAVLQGGFYSKIETHLFADQDGAKKAFDRFSSYLKATPGNQPQTAEPVGNQHVAFQRIEGKVPTSSVNSVYHYYLFRRGNLVSVVFTYGADGFMKIDTAREMAYMVDQKALGKATAVEPTPTSNYTPAATPKK
ncbi:MAG: hypothetical protein ABI782_09830 [Anaerolineaceae bacterium]